MEKKKVLILYNQLFHYRIPIFNLLAEKYDITFVYSEPQESSSSILSKCHFKTIFIPNKHIWKCVIHKHIRKVCSGFDVILAIGDVSWLSYSMLVFFKKYHPFIFWSIGVPASYHRPYGEASLLYYKIIDFFSKRADANIFYSEFPIKGRIERGYKQSNLFVANNTVEVAKININPDQKKTILFIGTLYLEKGLQQLLDSYRQAYLLNSDIVPLNIVGGGVQFDLVKDWIKQNKLEHKIHMLGPIYDKIEKSKVFANAIVCISPKQAGLSVLESMGYGVPYVTSDNAITGGEAFNIVNGETGLRLKDLAKLPELIIDISSNKEKFIEMGQKAYKHYWSCRKPEDMAIGISDAIEYVLINKNKS